MVLNRCSNSSENRMIFVAPAAIRLSRGLVRASGWRNGGLPIYLSQYHIDAADCCHNVGNQPPLTHPGQGLQVGERRRAHVDTIRLGSSIADHVIAHLTAW